MKAFRHPTRHSTSASRVQGFSLVEMAIALMVFALLVGGMLLPLSAQIEQRHIVETQRQLEDIKAALMGFAAANGRLPCPASSTSNGRENFAAGGTAANGNCSNFLDGFLPAVTLGLTPVDPDGYALDAWALPTSRIRYAVSNATVNAQTNPFTKTNGIKSAGIANVANADLLHVCASSAGITASSCGTAVTLAGNAVVVIYSLAGNPTAGGAGADEQANLNADKVFVSHPNSAATGNEFDDLVTWLAPSLLLNRMIEAGRLP